MKQVAIVGIQGVPARYGGFETLVENIIGDNCCSEVRYTVFCSGKNYATHMKTYKEAQLKYVPLFHANGAQSTPYDILSMLKCLRGYTQPIPSLIRKKNAVFFFSIFPVIRSSIESIN